MTAMIPLNGLIYQKMAKILREVDAIEKTRSNTQGWKFRGIDDALNALHGVFAANEVFLAHEVMSHDVTERTTAKGGIFFHHLVKVAFRFYAADGSQVSAVSIGEAADSSDKGAGKAMSYALKSCLLQTFLIPTEEEKDPDFQAPDLSTKKNPLNPPPLNPTKPSVPAPLPPEMRSDSDWERHVMATSPDPVRFQYDRDRMLVVACSSELGIDVEKLKEHREPLKTYLEIYALNSPDSIKKHMKAFFDWR